MSGILLLLALSGCGGQKALDALAPPEVALVARVDEARVDKDEAVKLEIRGTASEGWTLTPGQVSAEGLQIEAAPPEGPAQSGDQQVWTWRYALSGPPGSYVIEPGGGVADGPGGQHRELETPPIFVDIGVTGPSGGPMAELEELPAPEPPPWGLIAGGAALALELSRILRVYVEAITGFPATARTSREILRALETEARLELSLRVRAGHILDATDRLKFAREGGGEGFFKALDEDFLAVLDATRPKPPPPAPQGVPRA